MCSLLLEKQNELKKIKNEIKILENEYNELNKKNKKELRRHAYTLYIFNYSKINKKDLINKIMVRNKEYLLKCDDDIFLTILNYLNYEDKINMKMTCATLNKRITKTILNKELYNYIINMHENKKNIINFIFDNINNLLEYFDNIKDKNQKKTINFINKLIKLSKINSGELKIMTLYILILFTSNQINFLIKNQEFTKTAINKIKEFKDNISLIENVNILLYEKFKNILNESEKKIEQYIL